MWDEAAGGGQHTKETSMSQLKREECGEESAEIAAVAQKLEAR
jgi:hypothetical protein